MNTFTTDKIGRIVVIHLKKGDDLLPSVQSELGRLGIKDGVLVSAIGSLRKASLHGIVTTEDLPTNEYYTYENPIELGNAQGLILNGEPHFHLTVTEPSGTFSGHMEPGCIVQYLAELVIIELPNLELTRKPDEFGISYISEKD